MGITSLGLNATNLEEVKEAARIALSLLVPYEESPWDEIQASADALNHIGLTADSDKSYVRHLITATYLYVYARHTLGSGVDAQADSFSTILATEDFAENCGLNIELDTDEYCFMVNLLELFIAELDMMD